MAENVLKTKPLYLFVVVVWLVLVVVFTAIILDVSINSATENFHAKAMDLYHHVNDQVNINETILDGFAATVDAMGKLDRAKIRDYTKRIREHYSHIFMFEIAEKVHRQDKTRFEQEMRQHVYPKFTIREFGYDSDRKWHPVRERPFYLPIIFMDPFPPESHEVMGLDLNSNPIFIESLHESAKLHTPVVTRPFELVEGQIAYVIHRPIKDVHDGHGKEGIDDRYVILVILAKSLINAELSTFQKYGISLYSHGFPKNSSKAILYKQPLPACDALRAVLFPRLSVTLPLESKTQPFVLSVERQLGWRALNWGLLGTLFIVALITYFVLIHFAKVYHLTQIIRIQEANHFFYLANHDSLTGLANRNLLMDRLGHALKQAKRASSKLVVLFLDLDNFKQVNDRYGHEIGDKVLINVAERLRDCVRSGDTLARRSGDEFVIVLENITTQDKVEQVIDKIQTAFTQHFDIEGIDIGISISIGFASYPDEAGDATELLKLADKRMYEKK